MKIGIIDFSCNNIDTIDVDKSFIDKFYEGDVEEFLSRWCGYSLDNCQWIAGDGIVENIGLSVKDFGGDDELELSDSDKKMYNL